MRDIKLNYVEKGRGAVLVLLHGNGESHEYFSSQIDFFAEAYRVIAVDTRGHGESPRGNAPFTLSCFADDLKDFLDGLGIEKANILGFSDGGNIALLFVLKYPQYVSKLILSGANLYPLGVKLTAQLPICMGYGIVYLISQLNRTDKQAVRKMEMLRLMVKEPHIKTSELSRISSPTLVIAGTQDLIRKSHTRLIAKSIPDSKLCFITGDHYIAAKNSENFNRAVQSFLTK